MRLRLSLCLQGNNDFLLKRNNEQGSRKLHYRVGSKTTTMKYSSQQINNMSWQEWNEVMADELNKAGFVSRPGTQWEHPHEAGDEPEMFILGEVSEKNEINYLKTLGLLNNGRCPMCGNPIVGNPGRFTSGYDYDCHFQICQNCVNRGKRISVNPANTSSGCIVALLLFPIHLLKFLIGL